MTRDEIKRHARAILQLRSRQARQRHMSKLNDFDPKRRRVRPTSRNHVDSTYAPVDDMFRARERSGRIPRGYGYDD